MLPAPVTPTRIKDLPGPGSASRAPVSCAAGAALIAAAVILMGLGSLARAQIPEVGEFSLDFFVSPAGQHRQYLTIHNPGPGSLAYQIVFNSPWLQPFSGSAGSIPAGNSRDVEIMGVPGGAYPPGTYSGSVTVTTNHPNLSSTTRSATMIVRDTNGIELNPTALQITTTWRAEAFSVPYAVLNGGGALGPMWGCCDRDWLWGPEISSLPAQWTETSGVHVRPRDLAPGVYSADLELGVFGGSGPIATLPLALTVLPTPPRAATSPTDFHFRTTSAGAPQILMLKVANSGYESLDFTISESASWLFVGEPSGSIGPDGTVFIRVSANPTDLDVGQYESMIHVATNDVLDPAISIPVSFEVYAVPPGVLPEEIAIEEVGFLCGNGSPAARFLELANEGMKTEEFSSQIGIEIRDRTDAVIFTATGLFSTQADDAPWPAGSSWLLASPEFSQVSALVPDATLPLTFDALGGSIRLFKGPETLHEFVYGHAGGVNAPAAGHSLALQPGGTLRESDLPRPRNYSGGGDGQGNCPCPMNWLWAGDTSAQSTSATLERFGAGGRFGEGHARYDLSSGSYFVEGIATWAGVRSEDSFQVTGVTAGTPLHLEARARYTIDIASGTPDPQVSRYGNGAVTLIRTGQTPAVVNRHVGNSRPPFAAAYAGEVVLPLNVRALEPFVLTVETTADGSSHGGGGRTSVQLEFLGLPPGAAVRSCQGYSRAAPVPIAPVLAQVEADIRRVRLQWTTSTDVRWAQIARRIVGDEGGWVDRGVLYPEDRGRIVFVDLAVVPGTIYEYRLTVDSRNPVITRVEVPSHTRGVSLSLISPATGRGVITVVLEIPAETARARLGWFDVLGRQLRVVDFGALSAGRHELMESISSAWPAGIYFARFSTDVQSVSARLVLPAH